MVKVPKAINNMHKSTSLTPGATQSLGVVPNFRLEIQLAPNLKVNAQEIHVLCHV